MADFPECGFAADVSMFGLLVISDFGHCPGITFILDCGPGCVRLSPSSDTDLPSFCL